jgi:two-component system sensor histidine kinase KdpD
MLHVKNATHLILRFAGAAAMILAIAIFYFYVIHANSTTAGFTFLLAVLTAATMWGRPQAIFMAVVAALCLDYFFLPPVLHFTIADPRNWVAEIVFLVTALLGGQLSERARREAANADHRRREAERLYDFTQRLLATDNIVELLNAVPRYIVETFGVAAAGMFLAKKREVYYSDQTDRGLLDVQELQMVSTRGEAVMDPERGLAFIPLRMGVRTVGSLGIAGGALSRGMLDAISTLVASAIERAGAVEQLSKTEAVRESERLRSVLLDAVTHEFRTPLTSIKASAESLLSDFQLTDAQRRELLTVINEESDRLNRLITEATEMAQLDAGSLQLHRDTHSLQEAVDAALAESRQALATHPVEVEVPANLPPAFMDVVRIAEVLAQLLDNAAKYSPAGSPIRITGELTDGMITASVADHGAGIDSFEQSLIFDKFYRGRQERSSVQGTGMGLAIAKAIVEAHGGTIGATSQIGHGSVFHFTLPVA